MHASLGPPRREMMSKRLDENVVKVTDLTEVFFDRSEAIMTWFGRCIWFVFDGTALKRRRKEKEEAYGHQQNQRGLTAMWSILIIDSLYERSVLINSRFVPSRSTFVLQNYSRKKIRCCNLNWIPLWEPKSKHCIEISSLSIMRRPLLFQETRSKWKTSIFLDEDESM